MPRALLLVLVCTACSADGEPAPLPDCDGAREEIPVDQPFGNDSSAAELLDAIEGSYDTDARTWDGGMVDVSLGVAGTGNQSLCTFGTQATQTGTTQPDGLDEVVIERLDVEVEVVLRTGDGAFNERFRTYLSSTNGHGANGRWELDGDRLRGSYAPVEADESTLLGELVLNEGSALGTLRESTGPDVLTWPSASAL